jgi:hypothetical protein
MSDAEADDDVDSETGSVGDFDDYTPGADGLADVKTADENGNSSSSGEDEDGCEDDAFLFGSEDADEDVEDLHRRPGSSGRTQSARPPSRVGRQAAAAPADTRRIFVVPDDDRITSNCMTLAEATRAVAIRAEHLARYPYVFSEVVGVDQAKDLALAELLSRRSPLVLRRVVGRTLAGERIIERWRVREMAYPPL